MVGEGSWSEVRNGFLSLGTICSLCSLLKGRPLLGLYQWPLPPGPNWPLGVSRQPLALSALESPPPRPLVPRGGVILCRFLSTTATRLPSRFLTLSIADRLDLLRDLSVSWPLPTASEWWGCSSKALSGAVKNSGFGSTTFLGLGF